MTELELLIDFHKDAHRQGPGSTADTLKALSFVGLEPGLKLTEIATRLTEKSTWDASTLSGQFTCNFLNPLS